MASVGLCACGALAPFVFIVTVYLGASWRPHDYSHISRAVSELTERGAPNKRKLDLMFLLYNILSILGATGFYLGVITLDSSTWTGGAACYITATCLSLLMTVFPMDPISKEPVPLTLPGKIHLIDAAITSFFILVTLAVIGSAAINDAKFYGYGVFTLACFALQLVSGTLSAIAAVRLHPWMGLAERVTLGIYLLWMLVSNLYIIVLGGALLIMSG